MAKRNMRAQLELLEAGEREAILYTLYARGGAFSKAIDEEVQRRLSLVTAEDVADDVVDALSEVDDDAAYANSGRGPWGYRDYGEAVSELLEEEFGPFIHKMVSFIKEGRHDIARSYVKGIILGCHRFEQECRSDYIDAIPDDCLAFAEGAWDTWKKHYGEEIEALEEVEAFIAANCPEWERKLRR